MPNIIMSLPQVYMCSPSWTLLPPASPYHPSGLSQCKESACNAEDTGSIPGSRRSPGEGNVNPLQYSCLESPMDRGAWLATNYRVARVGHNLATERPTSMFSSKRSYYGIDSLLCHDAECVQIIDISFF